MNAGGTVKRDFQTFIGRYSSQKENFEYCYPHSNALLQAHLKLGRCKPHNAAHHPTKCDVINDAKLFSTVYCRIDYSKFLTLSNQKSRYRSMCISMSTVLVMNLNANNCWQFKIYDQNKFHAHAQLSMKLKVLIKTKIPTNEEVSCFKSLGCCIYHANKC